MVGMIFICKSIHLSTKIFVSTIFNHSSAECFISYESVMDSLETLFLASFLHLVSQIIFFVSQLLTISMSVRSSFLDDVLRDRKKVHRVIDELLIGSSFFMQEMPACAIDDADIPI